MAAPTARSVLRIGVVNFLNAYPLWAALPKVAAAEPGIALQLEPDMPAKLVTRLAAGELDAALISSIAYFKLPVGYGIHPYLCIGARDQVWSIRLFMKDFTGDFWADVSSLEHILLDAASRSSVAQLQHILGARSIHLPTEETVFPERVLPGLHSGQGILAIGDTALRNRELPSYDLQQIYWQEFGREFVYALWVFRDSMRGEIESLLTRTFEEFRTAPSAYIAAAAKNFGFSDDLARQYLGEIIRYELTPQRRNDLEYFAGMVLGSAYARKNI